jgi:uncharacterized protein YmfQ (DUF2313 family)
MSLAPGQILSLTFMLQPGGWALPRDPASVWGKFLTPMATAWSGVQASMESMLPQVDPRQATALLPAWEAALGPDPCGRDLLATTVPQRQALAYQRLTARGGSSIAYFLSLVTAVGDTATIIEGAWCNCGDAQCGAPANRLSAAGNQFNWMVLYAAATVTPSVCGEAQCGLDRCGGLFTQSQSQCPIAHASPAHTVVTFNYTGSF